MGPDTGMPHLSCSVYVKLYAKPCGAASASMTASTRPPDGEVPGGGGTPNST
jgi:hypothetical protein